MITSVQFNEYMLRTKRSKRRTAFSRKHHDAKPRHLPIRPRSKYQNKKQCHFPLIHHHPMPYEKALSSLVASIP